MNDSLEALQVLQKLDAELYFLRELRLKRPQEMERERKRLREAQRAVEMIREGIKELRMQADRKELDIKNLQAENEKLQIALNVAKSNQEYQVLRDQIERKQEAIGELEEAVLETFQSIDGLNVENAQAEGNVGEVESEVQAKQAELDAFILELDGRIEDIQGRRNNAAGTVDDDTMEIYRRVLEKYPDSALALCEAKVCQGCYMSITTQNLNLLLKRSEIVQCPHCLRILHLGE